MGLTDPALITYVFPVDLSNAVDVEGEVGGGVNERYPADRQTL